MPRRGGRDARLRALSARGRPSGDAARGDPGDPDQAALPDPDHLTRHGLSGPPPASRAGRTLVIACGALARELLALRGQGLSHLDLHCLPAILHNTPDRIPEAVEATIEARAQGYDGVLVAYADCGTGGALRRLCDRLGARMIPGPHCYAFYEGLDVFEARDEIDAFYLTDFLARQFDAFVTRPLGLDRHPELRNSYFGQYRKLVYLAQTDDPALEAAARAAAGFLGLDYTRRLTGLGPFRMAVKSE